MDEEELRKLIMERTGISRSELDRLVEKKIREFAGLLTELGALYAIAKDMGIDVSIDRSLGLRKKISELKQGDTNVSVVGRVTRVIGPREVRKGDRKIKYASVYVYDGSGEVRLVLWGRDADLVSSGKIRRGSVVEVINARVEEFGGRLSLSLGYDGRLLLEPSIEEEIPGPEPVRVKDLSPGAKGVELELLVKRSFPVREVRSGEGTVKYGSFIGSDDTGEVRVVLWRENAREVPVGSRVRVFGDVKDGRRGVEIHVGKTGAIEIIESPRVALKFLDEVKEGEMFTALVTVARIYSTKPYTGRCNVCGGDVVYKDGRFLCSSCGSEDVKVTPILAMEVDDGFRSLRAVAFGDVALSVYGDEYPGEGSLERARSLLGKDVLIEGRLRRNEVLGREEIVVERIYHPDFYEIYDLLLQRIENTSSEKPEGGVG